MTLGILVAVALSLPPSSQAVRVSADSWPSVADVAAVEAPKGGEKLWWWSDHCAPVRLTADAPQAECGKTRMAIIRVVDQRGRAVAASKIVWGSSEMLSDLPEAMLPDAVTAEDGKIAIPLPLEAVWI